MSIITTYPLISDVAAEDLLIIADMSILGTPTRTVNVQKLLEGVTGGVTQIVAGQNVTISPSGGTGIVTINASGGGGSGSVTSVSASTAGDALDVAVTNATTTPDLAFTWAGTNNQYINGAGDLATLPATATTYNLDADQDGLNVDLRLTPSTGSADIVQFTAGSGISLTETGNNNITIAASGSGGLTSVGASSNYLTIANSPLTSNGVIQVNMPANGVPVGTYTNATVTVDQYGFVTNASSGTGGGTTYDLASAQDGNNVDITLTPATGAVDTVQLTAGTNITLTDNGSNNITIDAAGGGGGGGVSSIGLSTDITAFTILNSPITTAGTLQINKNGGLAGQYLNQDGTWQYGIFKKDANDGIYVSDRTVANYGAIGANSFDASFSTTATGVNGAVGDHSAAFGENNRTTQNHSLIAGENNDATFARHSFVFGKNNVTDMWSSIVGGVDNVVTGSVSALISTSQVVLGYGNSITSAGIGVVLLGKDNTGGSGFGGAMIGNTNAGDGTRQYIYGSDNSLGTATSTLAVGNINSIPGTNSGYAYGNGNTISNAVTPVSGGYAYGSNNIVSGSNAMAYGHGLTASEDLGIYIGSGIGHGSSAFRRIIMPSIITMPSYADDTAAAAGGVVVGELYRDGSTIKIRVT